MGAIARGTLIPLGVSKRQSDERRGGPRLQVSAPRLSRPRLGPVSNPVPQRHGALKNGHLTGFSRSAPGLSAGLQPGAIACTLPLASGSKPDPTQTSNVLKHVPQGVLGPQRRGSPTGLLPVGLHWASTAFPLTALALPPPVGRSLRLLRDY